MEHGLRTCDCGEGPCRYCGGGLADCVVCHGAEGSLTTDCPGEPIPQETLDRVYAGAVDYREGRGWCAPDGTGTSMGDHGIQMSRRGAAKEKATR